ncbi:hypothetical protein DRJ22_05735 [Candidatus Woesearchaeota archaeon]|nr:hypothetical protein [Candidatus Woesearchaeota archaeon]RLE40821.1 MAG: hypothetical protein DRZ77_01120 [Candidatus Woesearchaeota archaeon]RLE44616.1 MAG: hypothetical protein DRJ22_05735 [Candidatus Woesearchaeota archaeon]
MIFFRKKAREVAGLEVPPPPEEEIEIKAIPKKEIKVKPEEIEKIEVAPPAVPPAPEVKPKPVVKVAPKKEEIKVIPEKIEKIRVKAPEVEEIEREIVEEEKEEFEALKEHRIVKPVFVRLETYSAAMEELMLGRTMAKEVSEAAKRLIETRELQRKEYENWQKSLLDAQKKLIFADKILFG